MQKMTSRPMNKQGKAEVPFLTSLKFFCNLARVTKTKFLEVSSLSYFIGIIKFFSDSRTPLHLILASWNLVLASADENHGDNWGSAGNFWWWIYFLVYYFAAPWQTLGHYWGHSLTHAILITSFFINFWAL